MKYEPLVGRSKCRCCGGTCIPSETAQYLSGFADNPLIVREVIWYYSDVLGFHEFVASSVCKRCAIQDVMKVLDENSWEDPSGYFILRGIEETYGRYATEQLGSVQTVIRPENDPRKRTRRTIMARKTATNVDENIETVEGTIQENVVAAAKETAEERWASQREALAVLYPVGTFVKLLQVDFKNSYGQVIDIVTLHGSAYVQVEVQKYSSGKPRVGKGVKVLNVRTKMLELIEEKDIPVFVPAGQKVKVEEPLVEEEAPAESEVHIEF